MVKLFMFRLPRLLQYPRNLTTLTRTTSAKTQPSGDPKVPDCETRLFSIRGHHGAVYTKAKVSEKVGQNQDGAIIHKNGIALCDAMGGLANGVEMKERFLHLISKSDHLPPKKEAFIETFSSLSEGGLCGTIFKIDPESKDKATVMLFGDMKFLRLREGKIIQESSCDYTKLLAGKIDQDTYEQRRHFVDGALIIKKQEISWPKVQLYPLDGLTPNDTIVLCSDGISDCIPSSVITKLISEMTTEQSIEKILKFHKDLKDIDSSQNRFFTETDQLNDLYKDNDLDPLPYYPPFKLDDVVLAICKPG